MYVYRTSAWHHDLDLVREWRIEHVEFVLGQLRSGGYLDELRSPGDRPSEALVDNDELSRLEEVQLEWQELFQAVLEADAQRQRLTRCDASAYLVLVTSHLGWV